MHTHTYINQVCSNKHQRKWATQLRSSMGRICGALGRHWRKEREKGNICDSTPIKAYLKSKKKLQPKPRTKHI